MAGVPQDDVHRRPEHPVHRDGQLHDAEIRAEMAAGAGHVMHEESPDLGGQRGELDVIETSQVTKAQGAE